MFAVHRVIFVATFVFACIVIGLSVAGAETACSDSDLSSAPSCGDGIGPSWIFGIGVGAITLPIITTVMIVDKVRTRAFTSLLWVEMSWVFVLSMMYFALLGLVLLFQTLNEAALAAVSALAALLLLGWFIALVVFGFKGRHWTSHVSDANINAPKDNQEMTQKYNIEEEQNAQALYYGPQVPQQDMPTQDVTYTEHNPYAPGKRPIIDEKQNIPALSYGFQIPQQDMPRQTGTYIEHNPYAPGNGSIVV